MNKNIETTSTIYPELLTRFVYAKDDKQSTTDLEQMISSANGYVKYFENLLNITNNMHERLSHVHKAKKGIALCYDTNVILGWILGDINNDAFSTSLHTRSDDLVGPSVLSYLLNSSDRIYLPAGTILELEDYANRILGNASRVMHEFNARQCFFDTAEKNNARDFAARLIRSLNAIENATTQITLLGRIRDKSMPVLDILGLSARRVDAMKRKYEFAVSILSERRPNGESNNEWDSLNFAEVSTWNECEVLGNKIPFLITTTSAVLELSRNNTSESPDSFSCVVHPDEMSLFLQVARRFGWPDEEERPFLRGEHKLSRWKQCIQDLYNTSIQLRLECIRLKEETSQRGKGFSAAHVRSSLDDLGRKHEAVSHIRDELLQECKSSSGQLTFDDMTNSLSIARNLRLRDSHIWSQKLRSMIKDVENQPTTLKEISDASDKINDQIKREIAEFDASSGLLSLQKLFESIRLEETQSYRSSARSKEPKPSVFYWSRISDLTLQYQEMSVQNKECSQLRDLIRSDWDDCLRLACTSQNDTSPLFFIDVRQLAVEENKKWVIDIAFSPSLSPSEVWEIESRLYSSQLNTDTSLKHQEDTILERAFIGELLFEIEHTPYSSHLDEDFLTPWDGLCEKHENNSLLDDQTDCLIHYADIVTRNLTFYIQTLAGGSEEYKAGLILTAPIQPRQLSPIAKLLSQANRYKFAEKDYRDLLSEVIGLLPVF